MKQIIPAGTPGTFRPAWGQFPEADSDVTVWQVRHNDGTPYSLHRKGASVRNNPAAYAWQYTTPPPPVDDFEAFLQKWGEDADDFPYFYAAPAAILYINGQAATPCCFTLESAQRAAYQHFLESLNS